MEPNALKCFPAATWFLISSQVHFNKHLDEMKTNMFLLMYTVRAAQGEMFSFLWFKRLSSVRASVHIFLAALLHVCPSKCSIYSSSRDSFLKLQTFLNGSGCAINYSCKNAIRPFFRPSL